MPTAKAVRNLKCNPINLGPDPILIILDRDINGICGGQRGITRALRHFMSQLCDNQKSTQIESNRREKL